MLIRSKLLACLEDASERLTPYQQRQVNKFHQKRQITPFDFDRFRERMNLSGEKLLHTVDYDRVPKNLTYPEPHQIQRRVALGQVPKQHHFAMDVPEQMRKPMARTVRHLERLGVAAGGQHDSGAARAGYYRMTFHPKDDAKFGVPASKRSRMAMDRISHHYPDLPIDHYKDELSDGRHVHHLEIPHSYIPAGIRHLKECHEVEWLLEWISES